MSRSLNLPDGWTHEYPPVSNAVFLIAPNKAGFMTVDFNYRCYRTGLYAFSGRAAGPEHPPTGRGWKERLIQGAVEHLTKILA